MRSPTLNRSKTWWQTVRSSTQVSSVWSLTGWRARASNGCRSGAISRASSGSPHDAVGAPKNATPRDVSPSMITCKSASSASREANSARAGLDASHHVIGASAGASSSARSARSRSPLSWSSRTPCAYAHVMPSSSTYAAAQRAPRTCCTKERRSMKGEFIRLPPRHKGSGTKTLHDTMKSYALSRATWDGSMQGSARPWRGTRSPTPRRPVARRGGRQSLSTRASRSSCPPRS